MGLLTSIFVAPTDAPPDPTKEPESEPGQGIQLKSITSMNLSTLWAMLDGANWTPDRMDGFESLSVEVEGPWLERCPKAFLDALRKIDEKDLDASVGNGRQQTRWRAGTRSTPANSSKN
jgi:hypothetical protein